MTLLRPRPELAESLRAHPLTTDEMRVILDDVLREIAKATTDDLPPEDDES